MKGAVKVSIYFCVSVGLLTSCNPAVRDTLVDGTSSASTVAPSADQIVRGATVLGVAGTAGKSFGEFSYSAAFRSDIGVVNLSDVNAVGARQRLTQFQESSGGVNFQSLYRLVPDPKYDTDGHYTDTGTVAKATYLETVKGRPTIVCGLAGDVQTRITDCEGRNTLVGVNHALWEGSKYGRSGEGDWELVTLYKVGASSGTTCVGGSGNGCYEVWRDKRTGLVWSDHLSKNYNWFQAAGYSSSVSTVANTFYEGRAGGFDANCSPVNCQPAAPVSACVDASILNSANAGAGTNGLNNYVNTAADLPTKGNLGLADSVVWRLPSLHDWLQAEIDGVRNVLPNLNAYYHTATSNSQSRGWGWMYWGDGSTTAFQVKYSNAGVHCVGSAL